MMPSKNGIPVTMRTIFLLGIVALVGCVTSCHAAPAPAGTVVILPVSLSTGTTAVTALQFDLTLPVGVSTETVTAGSSATAAQKTLATSMVLGALRVLISGVNQTPIPSGPVALIALRLAPNMGTGTFPLVLTNTAASDPAGLNVSLSASVSGVLSVIANTAPFLKVGSN